MKPIKFKEQNVIFAENQPEYIPLPAYIDNSNLEGKIICCWKLSWFERFKLLITGKLWHQILTFRKPLQPQLILVDNPFNS